MKEREKLKSNSAIKSGFVNFKVRLKRAKNYLLHFIADTKNAFWMIFSGEFSSEKSSFKDKMIPIIAFSGTVLVSAVMTVAPFSKFEIFPSGFALLSSVGQKAKEKGLGRFSGVREKNISILSTSFSLAVFSGVLIGSAFLPKYNSVYFFSFVVLFLIRSGVTDGKLNENIVVRLFYATVTSIFAGIVISAQAAFSLESVIALVTMAILSPVFAYLLSGIWQYQNSSHTKYGDRRTYLVSAFSITAYLSLYVIKDIKLFGFSPAYIISVIITFATAKKFGALYGAIAGVVTGLSQNITVSVPTLALSGFFSGIFFEFSTYFAIGVSFVISSAIGIYSGGITGFAAISSDYLAGIFLTLPILKTFGEKEKPILVSAEKEVRKETIRETKKKLKSMSDAFSSLSEVFYTVSDTIKKPEITETTKLVSDSFSEICSKCPKSEKCWGKEYSSSLDMTSGMAAKLISGKKIDEHDFCDKIFDRCDEKEKIAVLINKKYKFTNTNFYKTNKTRLLAGEYSTISKLFKNTAGDINKELEYNPSLEKKAKNVLNEIGVDFRKVAVFGSREMKIDVYGVDISRIDTSTAEILQAFETEFDFPFDDPDFLMLEESSVMRLKRRRKFALECAKSGCMKKGEVVNGDTVSFFETDRDYFYTLICDGMGSGREAAFTSRLASIFIEKLMCCQSPKNLTFEMLNAFLMSKSDETFTTVDLFEIDLLSGEGNFIKAGAAPSYIVRGDRLHKIESKTLPYGIIENISAEKTTVPLKDGDYIIQMSDGVGEDESGEWILPYITACEYKSAGEVCTQILDEARERGKDKDDISISVVKVMNARQHCS